MAINVHELEGRVIRRNFEESQKKAEISPEHLQNLSKSVGQAAEIIFGMMEKGHFSSEDKENLMNVAKGLKNKQQTLMEMEPGSEEIAQMQERMNRKISIMRQLEEHEEQTKDLTEGSDILNKLQDIAENLQGLGAQNSESVSMDGGFAPSNSISTISNDISISRRL